MPDHRLHGGRSLFELKALAASDDTDPIRQEFTADDAATALFVAQRYVPRGCTALLLQDGEPLATLTLDSSGFWTVGPASGSEH